MEKKDKSTDKLTDKAFSRLLITTVIGVLLCLACLCSATWAWFSADIKSSENKIETGKGLMTVTVTKDGENIDCVDQEKMLEAGDYEVKMTLPENSASGYCIVVANGKKYLSPYIYKADAPKTVKFTLRLEEETIVNVKTHWGIYSTEPADVIDGGTLTLPKVST